MSETCSVCGTDVKKPYKHTFIQPVSIVEWKDYHKKDKKIQHSDKPGTIVTYYCSYDSMIMEECVTKDEEE
jgi:hypothetical protein